MNYLSEFLTIAPFSHALWRTVEAEAISQIKFKKPVLDIGCGFGEFAGVFFKSSVEMGIDICSKDVVSAAKRKKYKKLLVADARKLPFLNNSFNTIFAISTLEHIADVDKVFMESYRVLKPDGLLIFTVPTSKMNEMLFLPVFKKQILSLFHWSFRHEVIISSTEWIKKVKKAGFTSVESKNILSKSQLQIFQLGLLPALPTQLARTIFRKRFFYSSKIRTKIIGNLLSRFLQNQKLTEANILVVARKPYA